jgi:creatinine amidohydrolase
MRWLAASLAWPQVKSLAEGGAVALLPVGSTEAHGPHLPLSVDVVIAEEVCRRVALVIKDEVVQFPSVTYGLTDFAASFAGTVTLAPDVARAMLEGIVRGIVHAGFRRIALVNHHLEPAHFRVVHEAAKAIASETGATVLVPDHRRAPTATELGHEFTHGGSHAGTYETSLVLAAAPQLVNLAEMKALPELAIDLPGAIKGGAKDFHQAGGHEAYFGNPAAATPEEGHRLFDLLTAVVVRALEGHR